MNKWQVLEEYKVNSVSSEILWSGKKPIKFFKIWRIHCTLQIHPNIKETKNIFCVGPILLLDSPWFKKQPSQKKFKTRHLKCLHRFHVKKIITCSQDFMFDKVPENSDDIIYIVLWHVKQYKTILNNAAHQKTITQK